MVALSIFSVWAGDWMDRVHRPASSKYFLMCNFLLKGNVPLRMRKLGMDELGRLSVNEFRQSEKMPVVVVLDNIRSMHNVGSVFRTADAFLIQGVYLCGYT